MYIWLKSDKNYQSVYMKTQVCFIVAGDINSPKHFRARLSIFVLLTVTYLYITQNALLCFHYNNG